MDDTLTLFKGEMSAKELFVDISYKRLLLKREVRIERLVKEKEEAERRNKEAENEARNANGY